jgi:hypothetical protein
VLALGPRNMCIFKHICLGIFLFSDRISTKKEKGKCVQRIVDNHITTRVSS